MQNQHLRVKTTKIIVRVSSLFVTACKVGRMAAVQWQEELKQSASPRLLFSKYRAGGISTAEAVSKVKTVAQQADYELNSWFTTGVTAIASVAAVLNEAIRTQIGSCDSRDSRQYNHPGVTPAKSVACPSAETSTTCPTGSSQSFSISSSDTGRLHSFLLVMLLRAADACVLQLRAEDQGVVPCSADASRTKAAAACSQAAATDPASGSALVASFSIEHLRAIGHLLLSATAVLQHMPAKLDTVAAGEGDVVSSSTRQHKKQARQQQQRRLQQLCDVAHDPTAVVCCQPFGDSGKYYLACSSSDASGCSSLYSPHSAVVAVPDSGHSSGHNSHEAGAPSGTTAAADHHHSAVEGSCKLVEWRLQPQDFLLMMSDVPVTVCCNNPDCFNLSKLSECQLVSGSACVCGGCKVARYCCRECQKKHWKMHKHMCMSKHEPLVRDKQVP